MKTAMQEMTEYIGLADIDLMTKSVCLQHKEKQQIIDAFAHGMISHMLGTIAKRRENVDKMAEEYYEMFFNNQNHTDDKI